MTMGTSDSVEIGRSLAGYRLVGQVGRGGMGVVYRAHDAALDRIVAVKLVAPRLGGDRAFRDRFLVEARLAASLDHPNVVPVHDAGDIDGQLYLAMRFVDGTDLRALLVQEGQLDPERALAICGQVAAALDVAHERGLLHRDVKPSNVLLDEREHAYLADFGLTRRLSDAAPEFDAGLSLGTPAYVAPEQIEGKQTGPAADQYSLACMLYECLTGEPPYRRSSEAATLYAHLEDDPPCYPRLEHVFARALAKDPAERYESCAALVGAAREALPRTRRRGRLLAGITALVLAAAGALATVLVLTGDDGPAVGHHWTRVPHSETLFGGTLRTSPEAIADGPGGLVAVGTDARTFRETEGDVAVWTSADGITWARSTDPSVRVPGFEGGYGVIADASGYTMVGGIAPPAEDPTPVGGATIPTEDLPDQRFEAAVWRSGDGRAWRRIRSDSFADDESMGMSEIAAGPSGMVAVGLTVGKGLTIWLSPDGETWRRASYTDPVPRLPESQVWIVWVWDVVASEGGTIVAVGEDGVWDTSTDSAWGRGVIWVSRNGGETWARVPHDDALLGADAVFSGRWTTLNSVAVGDGGFVAVGSDTLGGREGPSSSALEEPGPAQTQALVLTSKDGLTWSRVPRTHLPNDGDTVNLEAITFGPGGYVAAGWRRNNPGVDRSDVDPVVWLSRDGQTWTEAADPTGAFDQPGGQLLGNVIWGGPGLIAIGVDGDEKGVNTAFWTSP